MSPSLSPSLTPDARRIFETWHETVRRRDLAGTAALYAEEAVLETPLALAVYPARGTGLVVGRAVILRFLEDALARFPADLAEWFRTGLALAEGRHLAWEYPRATPRGEQVDLMEMMEIEDGAIVRHRVYWGWYGVRLLAPALPVPAAPEGRG
ncbi:nuclear transport factor 2 family protein [Methylobacterium sp. JK268]